MARRPVEQSWQNSGTAMDLSLYSKIDDALAGMDTAFQSLLSAGLARDEEDEQSQSAESVGAPVFAREIGTHASNALQAIHRLKQTSIHSDWKTNSENKEHIRIRLELEHERMNLKLNQMKDELRGLVLATESSLEAGSVESSDVKDVMNA